MAWHLFPDTVCMCSDITTFTVYVTGCDLEKSIVFEKIGS